MLYHNLIIVHSVTTYYQAILHSMASGNQRYSSSKSFAQLRKCMVEFGMGVTESTYGVAGFEFIYSINHW